MRLRFVLVATLGALALIGAGCGGDDDEASDTTDTATVDTGPGRRGRLRPERRSRAPSARASRSASRPTGATRRGARSGLVRARDRRSLVAAQLPHDRARGRHLDGRGRDGHADPQPHGRGRDVRVRLRPAREADERHVRGPVEARLPRPEAAARVAADVERPEGMRWFRAPGRVNLVGDHTDYNEGFVLPLAIDRWCVVAARRAPDGARPLARRRRCRRGCRRREHRARGDRARLGPLRRRRRARARRARPSGRRHAGGARIRRPARLRPLLERCARGGLRGGAGRPRGVGARSRSSSQRRAGRPRSSRPASRAGSWTSSPRSPAGRRARC